MSKSALAAVVSCVAIALLLFTAGCKKRAVPRSTTTSASTPASTSAASSGRDAPPADHTIDADGFIAHDLTHGNGPFRLEITRQWRGSATLNSRFGPGWCDWNEFRLRMLSSNLVVIERGGVGWREAYRKDSKTFEGPEGDRIQKNEHGWSAQLPHGSVYTFNDKGRLTSIKTLSGPACNYAYDNKGRLASIGTSARNFLQYAYNDHNRVTAVRGPEGLHATYEYDNNGRLAAVVTARAYRVQYDYGADGRLDSAHDQLGSGILLSHLTATRARAAKAEKPTDGAPLPNTAKYQFDAQGRPKAVTENGSTQNYKYDASGALVEIEQGKQRATCKYDDYGRIVATQASDGSSTELAYNSLGLPTAIKKADGSIQKFAYDEHGRVLRSERSPVQWEEVSYDPRGRVATKKTPPALEARYSYGEDDRVTGIKYSTGPETRFEYDGDGRIVRQSSPTGQALTWRYDAAGHLVESISASGLKTAYEYNSAGQLTKKEDAVHGVTTFQSTAKGDIERNALGETTTRSSRWGKPLEMIGPSGARTVFGYNPRGLLESVLAPSGVLWRYEYDAAGNLTEIVTPGGLRASLAWDAAGRRSKVVRGGVTWRQYRYDAAGAWLEENSATGRAVRYVFGVDRQLASAELPNGKVDYKNEGGLRTIEAGTAYQVENEYKADGTLLRRKVEPSRLEIKLPADAFGRAAGIELNDLKVTYSYDKLGQVSAITLPGGNSIAIANDQAGRPTQLILGTSLVESIDYDRGDRVTGIEAHQKNGKPLFKETYEFDAAGNLAARNTDGVTFKFEYDRESRLVRAASPTAAREFSYDIDGNLTTDGEGKARVRVDKLGRPLEREATGYTWDKAGNLVQIRAAKGKISNVFDAAGRLTERHDGKKEWRFSYDAGNNRLVEEGPGGKRAFAYLDDTLGGFKDEHGTNWLVVYLPGTDQPIALCGSDHKNVFVISDRMGSARRFVDDKGAVIGTDDYTVFGNVLASKGKPPISIYAGMVRDDTGLFYARQRYYDPSIGRFISMDPLIGVPGRPATHNAYGYAANNPLRYRDPMGTGFDDDVKYAHRMYDYVYKKDPKDPTGNTFLRDEKGNLIPETYESGPFKGEPVVDKSQAPAPVENSGYDTLTAAEQKSARAAYDNQQAAQRVLNNPQSTVAELNDASKAAAESAAEMERLDQISKLRSGHSVMLGGERAGWGGVNSQQKMRDIEQQMTDLGADPFAHYTPETQAKLKAERAAGLTPEELANQYKTAADERAAADAAQKKAAEEAKAAAEQKAADEAARDARKAWVQGKSNTQDVGSKDNSQNTGAVSAENDSNKTLQVGKANDQNTGAVTANDANKTGAVKPNSGTAGETSAAGKSQAELAASAREKIERSLKTNEAISVSKEEMDAYDAEEAAKKAGKAENALVAQNNQPATSAGDSTRTGSTGSTGDTNSTNWDEQRFEGKPGINKDGSIPNSGEGTAGAPPRGKIIDLELDPKDGVWKPKGPIGGGGGAIGEGGEVGERWLGPTILEQGGKIVKWLKPIGEVAGPIAELIGTVDMAAKMANNFIDTLNEPFMKEKRERDAAKWAEEKYKQQLAQLAGADPDNIATRDGHKFDPKNPSDMDDLLSDLSDNLYWGRTPYNGLFKSGKISKKAISAPTSFMSADSGDTALPTALADAWNKMKSAVEKQKSATDLAKEVIRQQEEAKSQLQSAVKLCVGTGFAESDLSQLPVTADDVKKQTEEVKNQVKTLTQAYSDMSTAIDKTDDTAIKVCQWAQDAVDATPEKIADLKTKATNELQSASDMLNNAQAKIDGADFAVDQLTSSKAKLQGFSTLVMGFRMTKGGADKMLNPADALAAAKTAGQAASDARGKLDSIVSDVKSLTSQVVSIVAPFVASDAEAAALSASAESLGSEMPDVGLFDFNTLVSLSAPVIDGFIANQKAVDQAIGRVDIDALVSAADAALQSADSARQSAKKLASGPERYRGLQNASTCFGMLGSIPADKTAQTSESPSSSSSTGPTSSGDGDLVAVPAIEKIESASATLSAAGFAPSIVALPPQDKSMELQLAGQNPAPGEMKPRGSTVTVFYYQQYSDTLSPTPTPMTMAKNDSSPTPTATASAKPGTVPNLIGLTVDQASTRLKANMRIGSVDVGTKPPNAEKAMTIFYQNPGANSKFDADKPLSIAVKAYGSAKKEEPPPQPPPATDGGDVIANMEKKYQHYRTDFNEVGRQLGKRLAMESWEFSIRNRRDGTRDYFFRNNLARVVGGSGNNLTLEVTDDLGHKGNISVEISDSAVRMKTEVSVVVEQDGRSHWEPQQATITLSRSNQGSALMIEGKYPETPEDLKRLEQIFGGAH